jgi:ribosomal protein S18 acetylase RimI-like enzyme
MPNMSSDLADPALRHAETEQDLRACYPVMRQLRPHLQDETDLIQRILRMRQARYRLLAAWEGDEVVALAGYRLQENLIYGAFLYVDDLVTTERSRGSRWGARLLDELTHIAEQAECAKLVLDTGLANSLAHRFYSRQGLLTGAIRFAKSLD